MALFLDGINQSDTFALAIPDTDYSTPAGVAAAITAASGLKFVNSDVAESATTSLQVAGLSDGQYRVIAKIKAAIATATDHQVRINNASTGYTRGFAGSTTAGTQDSGLAVAQTAAVNGRSTVVLDVMISGGAVILVGMVSQIDKATNKLLSLSVQSSETTISTIDIVSTVADAMAIGSSLEVWEYVS